MDSNTKLPSQILSKYGSDLVQALVASRLPLIPPQQFMPDKPVLLIRHALSTMNFQSFQLEMSEGMNHRQRMEKLKIREDLVDARLHEIGRIHAQQAAPLYYDLSFKTIMVSPLRRAMDTMVELFKQHPKVGEIRFIVEPFLRQIMNISNDIPDTSLKYFRLLKDELKSKYNMNLDIQRIQQAEEPWAWALHTLKGERCSPVAQKFKQEIKEKELKEEQITEAFIKCILNLLATQKEYGFEDGRALYDRAMHCKNILGEELKNHKQGQILGVVAHSTLIDNMTSHSFDAQHLVPVGGTFPKNCQGLWIDPYYQ